MSPAVRIIALVCGAFVAHRVKASLDTRRLYKAGLRDERAQYAMMEVAQHFRDVGQQCASLPIARRAEFRAIILSPRAGVQYPARAAYSSSVADIGFADAGENHRLEPGSRFKQPGPRRRSAGRECRIVR